MGCRAVVSSAAHCVLTGSRYSTWMHLPGNGVPKNWVFRHAESAWLPSQSLPYQYWHSALRWAQAAVLKHLRFHEGTAVTILWQYFGTAEEDEPLMLAAHE